MTLINPNAVVFSVELIQQEESAQASYVGHRILILAGGFEPLDPSNSVWRFIPNTIPEGVLDSWINLQRKFFRESTMIRCRMALKGNFLFDPFVQRYLDCDAHTVWQDLNGDGQPQFEELTWSSAGDDRPGGSIEGWFWLVNRKT